MSKNNKLIIIPAYNEEKTLPSLLAKLKKIAPDCDLCLIDDGSDDATAAIKQNGQLNVIRHQQKRGYGRALKSGFCFAKKNSYSAILAIDADGQHEPEDVPLIFSALEAGESKIVLGSRFINREHSYRPGYWRMFGISFLRFVLHSSVKLSISDPTSGFFAVKKELLPFLVSEYFPDDYPDANLLIMLKRMNIKISEVPVRMYPNSRGKSMHSGFTTLRYALKMLLMIGVAIANKRYVKHFAIR